MESLGGLAGHLQRGGVHLTHTAGLARGIDQLLALVGARYLATEGHHAIAGGHTDGQAIQRVG